MFIIIIYKILRESLVGKNSIPFHKTKITATIHTWATMFSKILKKSKNRKNIRKVRGKKKFLSINSKKMSE